MILHRPGTRSLLCTCCGEAVEVKPEVWSDALAMRRLRREMELAHEPCKPFEGNPERARAERIFRQGMAAHAAELALHAADEGR